MNRMIRPGGRPYIADVVHSFAAADYQTAYASYLERRGRLVGPEFLSNVELDLSREFMTMD